MRHFLQEEKQIIDYICNLDISSEDIAISDLLVKFCHCSFECKDNTLIIYFNEHKYSEKVVINSILTIICFLKYLESESLIYVFQRTNIQDRNEIINNEEKHFKFDDNQITEQRQIPIEKEIKWTINGKTYILGNTATGISPLSKLYIPWDLVLLVDKYAKSILFCTETLRHAKGQDYKDDATIQYEETRCQTWIAIIISLLVGAASVVNETHHQ